MHCSAPYEKLELLLLCTDQDKVTRALEAGIDGIIVDWENQGKKERQQNFDTQINFDTYEDLCHLREIVPAGKLFCRINGYSHALTAAEVEEAIAGGADEIFLPMVTSPEQVRCTLRLVRDRCALNILIETTSALRHLDDLARLPLKRAYVGLNDLHIQQKSKNIFVPLMDGTVKNIRHRFSFPLGAGGVTFPASGYPINSRYLINEYARLGVNFSFLRRTFLKDCSTHDMQKIVDCIQSTYREARSRTPDQIERDYLEFRQKVQEWASNPLHA